MIDQQKVLDLLRELTMPYIWRVDTSTWDNDRFTCRVCHRQAYKSGEIDHAADCPIGKAIQFLDEEAVQ